MNRLNLLDLRLIFETSELIILNKILASANGKNCEKLNHLQISKTLPIIKNCNISICNDSSFSHLSAALNIPTIVLMADTPLLYGNYNPMMHPIMPDGENNVTHNTLGKDRINPDKIFKKFKLQLNKNEKIIFEKRIYCNKEDEVKLKELSALLNISIQRISKIESQIKEKLKSFYSVENKKITDIK